LAYDRAGRPKPAKLVMNLALRAKVEQDLQRKYSPEQITGWLLVEFPDDPEMRVSQRPSTSRFTCSPEGRSSVS